MQHRNTGVHFVHQFDVSHFAWPYLPAAEQSNVIPFLSSPFGFGFSCLYFDGSAVGLIDQRALRGFPHGINCNNQDNPMELPGIQVQVGKLSKWLISPIAWLFLKALGFFLFKLLERCNMRKVFQFP